LQEAKGWKFPLKLRDLLEQLNDNSKDVNLYHLDYDEEYATMVDLSLKDLLLLTTTPHHKKVKIKDENPAKK
jgi:hypothetical protein